MRDEELVLRFFAFYLAGLPSYRTPQKHWLNEVAKAGMNYDQDKIKRLHDVWRRAVDVSLVWFPPDECFRRGNSRAINRSLFDLITSTARQLDESRARAMRGVFRDRYNRLLRTEEFEDLISRAVDHTKRTKRRFEMWNEVVGQVAL